MTQLKTIAEVDSTIRVLGHLIESMPNEQLSKQLCDLLCYALIAYKAVSGKKIFKDSADAPGHLERKINDILQMLNEATIARPYQQQVSTLVKPLQEFKVENLNDKAKRIDLKEEKAAESSTLTLGMQ